jgi:GT2 family glycosyltransferase
MEPLVSIVLLSYRRPHYLKTVMESLLAQSYPSTQIIVIDNPSELSGEIELVVNRHPNVQLISPKANLGFTGGMNLGIQHASGEYVYLTEDDVVLDSKCIERLVNYAEGNPSSGLLSGTMYNRRSGTVRCAGGNMTVGSVFRLNIISEKATKPVDVSYIPGAMVFARRDLLTSLKGFREEFFMYYEDVDLCLRVLRRGARITVVPEVRADHFEPPEDVTPDNIEFHKWKNLMALYVIHAPLKMLFAFFARNVFYQLLRASWNDQRKFALLVRALKRTVIVAPSLWRERQA